MALRTLAFDQEQAAVFDERLLEHIREHFAVSVTARFVLGRHWRTANLEQRRSFVDALEGVTLRNLSSLIRRFPNGAVNLLRVAKEGEGKRQRFLAYTRVNPMTTARGSFDLTWVLLPLNEGIKIYDIKPEGISVALTTRTEYGSFLKAHGNDIDQLITALNSGRYDARP